jgi:hypothetical protein
MTVIPYLHTAYYVLTLLRGLDLTPITRKADAQEAALPCQMSDARCHMPHATWRNPNPRPPGPKSKKSNTTPQSSPHSHAFSRSSRSSRSPSAPAPGPRTQDPATHVSSPPAAMSSGRLKTEGTTETDAQSLLHTGALSCTHTGQGRRRPRRRQGQDGYGYVHRSRPGTTGTFRPGLAIEFGRESRIPSASGRGIFARETGYSELSTLGI